MPKKKVQPPEEEEITRPQLPPLVVRPEKYFMFVNPHGKVVPLIERHALIQMKSMQEYLGVIVTDDPKDFDKTAREFRAMKLPKEAPRDLRKSYFRRGRQVTEREMYVL